jgi:MFS family permease
LFVGTNIVLFTSAIPLGRLADRIGRSRLFVGGHVLLVGACACVVRPSGGLLLTMLCLILPGGFYAATDGVLAALTAGLAPRASRVRCPPLSRPSSR